MTRALTILGLIWVSVTADAAVRMPTRIVGLQYPRLAALARVAGKVELDAVLELNGHVRDVTVVSGHPLLIPAAREALRKWVFPECPTAARNCDARVIFNFVLEGNCGHDTCSSDLVVDLPNLVEIRSKRPGPLID